MMKYSDASASNRGVSLLIGVDRIQDNWVRVCEESEPHLHVICTGPLEIDRLQRVGVNLQRFGDVFVVFDD